MYRALSGVWLIFALAWLALLLNQAARLLHQMVALSQLTGHCRQDQDQDQEEEEESGGALPASLQDPPKL